MEFLVEFKLKVPDGTAAYEIDGRANAEAAAAAKLADQGHLVRLWNASVAPAQTVVGLYRADSQAELDQLLDALPLAEWMQITVTPVEPHPNDPAARGARHEHAAS